MDDPLSVSVLVLGPSGAGKTVYLASMFKHLATQEPELGVLLTTSFPVRKELSALYAKVARPGPTWPSSTNTAEAREFIFDCKTRHNGTNHPVLRIRYLDYAGELLTDSGRDALDTQAEADLQERIEQADTVLCLLDGNKLHKLCLGETEGIEYFNQHMDPVFGVLQEVEKPIHFVITKWDLLYRLKDSEAASLEHARDVLLDIRAFRNLVENAVMPHQNALPAIRLIPVSSVGLDYVEPQLDDSMVKLPGRIPTPLHVEQPLLAILPDLFASFIDSLDEETRRRLIRDASRVERLTPTERMNYLVGVFGDKFSKLISGTVGSLTGKRYEKVIDVTTQSVTAALRERAEEKLARREAALLQVGALTEEAAVARRIALHQMRSSLRRFEQVMPASILRSEQL
ncbi:DNA/RNA helicase domain-containing protein [Streptomyces sp. NPDC050738]|uniref:DNA/RNA helicase domain-containing protein n=1 Tax=Streptomyces sp. NPDC050738 TaxID=3154744 RepID=UPI00342CCC55